MDQSSTGRERVAGTVLTPREREIAGLVGQGMRNREIAAELVISRRIAESYVAKILTKLGFTSRAQIASWITTAEHPPRDFLRR